MVVFLVDNNLASINDDLKITAKISTLLLNFRSFLQRTNALNLLGNFTWKVIMHPFIFQTV